MLASGTAWSHNDYTQQSIEVFYSTDHGATWSYRSSCASESGQPNTQGHGIWEPEFAVAGNGDLVCYFSDERPSSNGYNQVLAHVVSTDGGATWGSEVYDVAVQDGVQRPGMTTVIKLPNGTYGMTFEDLARRATTPTPRARSTSRRHRTANWSPASSLGSLVQTSDGRHFLHTPQLAWSPIGDPNGTLLVSGQRLVYGSDGSITNQNESGTVLLANTNLRHRELDRGHRSGGHQSGRRLRRLRNGLRRRQLADHAVGLGLDDPVHGRHTPEQWQV